MTTTATLDLTPILSILVAAAFAVFSYLISRYGQKFIDAFDRRTNIQLTQQQKDSILSAATTEVGIIRTKLDQGILSMNDVHTNGPEILDHASTAINRVPDAAEKLNKTVPSMAQTIVGMIGNSLETKVIAAAAPPSPPPLVTSSGDPIPSIPPAPGAYVPPLGGGYQPKIVPGGLTVAPATARGDSSVKPPSSILTIKTTGET